MDFLIPPGTRPTRRRENTFQVSSYSDAYCRPLHLLPNPPLLAAREGACHSRHPRCHPSHRSLRHCPSASPLNLGSCLLFPARASGCLLLGSARPLGSTVRLRGPAQVRQTGLRTSVLPWRTGSRKRRYGTILCHLPTHCCPQPRFSSLSFCLPPESPKLSLSATSHPPVRPFSLACPSAAPMLPLSPTHRQIPRPGPHPKLLSSAGSF